ncbi:hypothetical protein IE81DRAFT_326630 [Ceraceosorus guamensis]|uniref:Uncharacterized protein n=1 Tax=Ceraceosorus guamensis TaxID=1522189 RepID=A0A316VP77_9BASI|nr:hypothetical protein IE81DRAFT_326630 [Ceraceosorus guamensis]PWN39377.1 hypothetical protein IE81DRAFT_326630 [Ceraceosorus guamensis]
MLIRGPPAKRTSGGTLLLQSCASLDLNGGKQVTSTNGRPYNTGNGFVCQRSARALDRLSAGTVMHTPVVMHRRMCSL